MRWKSLSWKIILLLILAGIIFLWLVKAPIISWYLTDKMKVPVSVGSVSIWPSQTNIRHFRIRNPRGFSMKSAFEADNTDITYRFSKLRGSPSEIDQIVVDGVFLGIECSNPLCSKNNWTAIGDRMVQKEERADRREVVIHKLIVKNMDVEVRGLGLGKPPMHKHIDTLTFSEISSERGFPTHELIRAIFGGAGIQDYIKGLMNPQNTLKKIVPGGLFGDTEEGTP